MTYYHGLGWVDIILKGYNKSIAGGIGLFGMLPLG